MPRNMTTQQKTRISSKLKMQSQEELEMEIQCAMKIMGHLKRLVYEESKVKYVNNLDSLNDIVNGFKSRLMKEAV